MNKKRYIEDEENWMFEELDEMIDELDVCPEDNEDEWDEDTGGYSREEELDEELDDFDYEDEDEELNARLKEDLEKALLEDIEEENSEVEFEEDEEFEMMELKEEKEVKIDLKKLFDF